MNKNQFQQSMDTIKNYVDNNIPTNVSDLTNDSGYITLNEVPKIYYSEDGTKIEIDMSEPDFQDDYTATGYSSIKKNFTNDLPFTFEYGKTYVAILNCSNAEPIIMTKTHDDEFSNECSWSTEDKEDDNSVQIRPKKQYVASASTIGVDTGYAVALMTNKEVTSITVYPVLTNEVNTEFLEDYRFITEVERERWNRIASKDERGRVSVGDGLNVDYEGTLSVQKDTFIIDNLLKSSFDYSSDDWDISSKCTILDEMYKGSKICQTNKGWSGVRYYLRSLVGVVKPRCTYTFSAYVRSTSANYSPKIKFYGSNSYHEKHSHTVLEVLTTDWQQISISFTFYDEIDTIESTNESYIRFEAEADATDDGYFQMCGLQLVRGNIVRDWSRGAYDINESITSITTSSSSGGGISGNTLTLGDYQIKFNETNGTLDFIYNGTISSSYVTDGLKLYINADEVSSDGTFNDLSGNNTSITNHSVPTVLEDGCINFVANNSTYLECGFSPNQSKWSIEMYFYFDGSSTQAETVCGWGASGDKIAVANWDGNFMVANLNDEKLTLGAYANYQSPLKHVVITFENGIMTSYTNGVKSVLSSSTGVRVGSTGNLMIGTKYSASGEFGNFNLKLFRFYDNKALSGSEVAQNYQNVIGSN